MDKHERNERHHYGVALMVIGWIATPSGTYMWQGKWPAIAAFGLGSLLWGLTLVLIAALARSEPRGADEDRAARASARLFDRWSAYSCSTALMSTSSARVFRCGDHSANPRTRVCLRSAPPSTGVWSPRCHLDRRPAVHRRGGSPSSL